MTKEQKRIATQMVADVVRMANAGRSDLRPKEIKARAIAAAKAAVAAFAVINRVT